MTKIELIIFIPSPGLSHLISTVEAANLLLTHGDHRLAITIHIMKPPVESNEGHHYTKKLSSVTKTAPRLRFIHLPDEPNQQLFIFDYINSKTDTIRQIVSDSDLIKEPDSRLAGIVLDMFCIEFIQVAREFSIPPYVFLTSSACSLGLFYDLVSLKFEHNQDLRRYKDSDAELSIRCLSQPLPAKVLPPTVVNGEKHFLEYIRKFFECKGILINTFYELEAYAVESLLSKYNSPKVYPVGPILEVNHSSNEREMDVMNWLDDQAEKSVVFLCFGTLGSLDELQVREFAKALDKCGRKFLWSLRKRGKQGIAPIPIEYDSFDEVLPEGFLEPTKGLGKVIGWAPQTAVLAHKAVGGFVSHCGWNSTLDSVWFGVPLVALPMFAEQQLNAFQLVRELGIAEEIRIDYNIEYFGVAAGETVPAEEIEEGIRRVMAEEGGGVRGKMEEMRRRSREAVEEGGSSYKSQIELIEDVMRNVGLE